MVLCALPLLWPDVPPLLDLPGHMGRYRVQLDLATSPDLQQYYGFDWQLIGNLGVDLLVELLAPLIGLEPAVKLVVHRHPGADRRRPVLGRLSKCTAGCRRPPCSPCPFAYNFPFLFGFVNFALAMALALNAFALWLRLGRLDRLRLRAALFVPISLASCGSSTPSAGARLGVLAFSAELVRQHDHGRNFISAGFRVGAPLPVAAAAGRADAAVAERGGRAAPPTGSTGRASSTG